MAPFDGIVGIRLVNVGDYLKDGADIVNIEDIEAIYVDYRLPERFQSKVKRGQTAMLDMDSLPGRQYKAQIQAIDPLIDANGRSVGLRACVDNRQLQLRPGMFARVNTVFSVRDDAKVIPEESIIPQGGRQFVIKLLDGPNEQTRTSQRVEVKVGMRSPGKVEILSGLEPGDTVVTAGQQRVQKDGTVVTVAAARSGSGNAARAGAERGAAGPSSAASAPAAAGPAAPQVAAADPSKDASKDVPKKAGRTPAAAAAQSGPNPCSMSIAGAEPAIAAPAPARGGPAANEPPRPASPSRDPA